MEEDRERESRLQRMAAGQGLIFGVERRGLRGRGYMLFADSGQAIALLPNDKRRTPVDVTGLGYEGTLDDIEAYLRRGEFR
jgi:hypothetical protein